MTNTVKTTTNRSEAMKKAWETRRANAAKKNAAAAPAPAPVVVVVAESPAPAPTVVKTAPKAEKPVRKGLTLCLCPDPNCKRMVSGNFAQGHDARLKGYLVAVRKGEKKLSDLRPDILAALPTLGFVVANFQDILGMLKKSAAA